MSAPVLSPVASCAYNAPEQRKEKVVSVLKPIAMAAMCLLVASCAEDHSARSSSPASIQAACHDVRSRLTAGIYAYNSGAFDMAFGNLKAASDCGDSDAQVNLGYMYARGQATPADQAEALRLHRLSADQGNAEGMNAIGYKYQFGAGIPADIGQAIYWYCKAVERGNPRAMNNLAQLYNSGLGVPRGVTVARDLWQQSAARGHTNALYNLGLSYLRSDNSDDRDKGAKLEISAAVQGNLPAQDLVRRSGYQGELPPPVNESALMKIQSSDLPPGHAPACE